MINITLPDGSVRQYDRGTTSMQIAVSISEGLARNVLAAEVDGQVWDASRPIEQYAKVKLLTWNDTQGKATFWHSVLDKLHSSPTRNCRNNVRFGRNSEAKYGVICLFDGFACCQHRVRNYNSFS